MVARIIVYAALTLVIIGAVVVVLGVAGYYARRGWRRAAAARTVRADRDARDRARYEPYATTFAGHTVVGVHRAARTSHGVEFLDDQQMQTLDADVDTLEIQVELEHARRRADALNVIYEDLQRKSGR